MKQIIHKYDGSLHQRVLVYVDTAELVEDVETLVDHEDALAAVEKARREERERVLDDMEAEIEYGPNHDAHVGWLTRSTITVREVLRVIENLRNTTPPTEDKP